MREQEMILRRMGIIGTLVVFVVGGVLLLAALIPSLAMRPASLQSREHDSLQAMPQHLASDPLRSVHPSALALPSILVPSIVSAPPVLFRAYRPWYPALLIGKRRGRGHHRRR
jgi:hypothetical protein